MQFTIKPIITLITILLITGCASSNNYRTPPQQEVSNYKPKDLTATGYASIESQPSRDPSLQRLMAIKVAKLEAYRVLASQVYGHYLDAQTSIGDLVLQNDMYHSRVKGVIYGAEIERIQPVGQDSYEVTLVLPANTMRELRRLYLSEFAKTRF